MPHKPGDRIKVRWGLDIAEGVVTSVSGDRIHVDLFIEGADEPVGALFRENDLVDASDGR